MRPLFLLCTLSILCGLSAGEATPKTVLAVIPKGTTHEFWRSVEAGARAAATELNVEIIWKGPINEGERREQITLVQDFINRKVDGICLAPLDAKALVRPVEDAVATGIPVVIFDSALESTKQTSFVATDNRAGGRLAGQAMVDLLKGKGRVAVLRYMVGSASTEAREAGFLEVVRKAGLEVVDDRQFAGADRTSALKASSDLLGRIGDRIDGIFTPNESSTAGMMLALQQNRPELLQKLVHVGFDSAKDLQTALRENRIKALVVQDPVRMGREAVATMVRHLRKQKVETMIDTGARLVTLEALKTDAALRELIGWKD